MSDLHHEVDWPLRATTIPTDDVDKLGGGNGRNRPSDRLLPRTVVGPYLPPPPPTPPSPTPNDPCSTSSAGRRSSAGISGKVSKLSDRPPTPFRLEASDPNAMHRQTSSTQTLWPAADTMVMEHEQDEILRGLPYLQLQNSLGVEPAVVDPEPTERALSPGTRFPSPISNRTISIRRGPQIAHFPMGPDERAAAVAKVIKHENTVFWALVATTAAATLSFMSATTFLCVSVAAYGSADTGAVVWLAMSAVVVMVAAGALFIGTRKQPTRPQDEEWIELGNKRKEPDNSPAPAPGEDLPGTASASGQENPDKFWRKFARDESQLRRYVETLEERVARAEADLSRNGHEDSTSHQHVRPPPIDSFSWPIRPETRPRGFEPVQTQGSRRDLLQPDTPGKRSVAVSATQGSILTQLCAAVTEPYSPLEGKRLADKLAVNDNSPARASSIDIVSGRVPAG